MNGDTPVSSLPTDHCQALKAACDILIDEFPEDVGRLLHGGDFVETWMSNYLPPQFTTKYTPLLAKKMLVCVVTVAWKLVQPGSWPLACVGEQLALHALIERAEIAMELDGEQADFADFRELAFPDSDILMLFEPSFDGIEDSDVGDYLGLGNLAPKHWFDPLYSGIPVHPYVADEP
ncbi:MAG TPA: hypothetical protein ENH00_09360 [Actinobacteria bacterium]|nr:hypothetical protein [Actinomycetota bacterium]